MHLDTTLGQPSSQHQHGKPQKTLHLIHAATQQRSQHTSDRNAKHRDAVYAVIFVSVVYPTASYVPDNPNMHCRLGGNKEHPDVNAKRILSNLMRLQLCRRSSCTHLENNP